MDELFDDKAKTMGLDDYKDILFRRKWWILGPLFFGFILVFASAWVIPAQYTSESTILVEQQKIPPSFVAPNVNVDLTERLQSISQQVLSRTRLLTIIKELHLYPGKTPDDAVEQMRNKDLLITPVMTQTANKREQQLTGFKLAYTYKDAEIAQAVNTRLASFFIDENVKQSQQQSQITTNFLDSQLKAAQEEMAATNAKVRDFEMSHNGQLPEQLQSNIQILSGAQAQLTSAMNARDRAMQQQEYLNSLLAEYESVGATNGVVTGPTLDQQLNNMKAALAELRTKYTEDHPDIKKLKEQIASMEILKKQIDDANREASKTDANATELSAMRPILQIQSQLKSIKTEIQNSDTLIQQLQAKAVMYQNRLNATPQVASELNGMRAQQEQQKKDFDVLLSKTAQSNLATNLQKEQQGEQFRIVDPPNLPDKPSFPDRFLFSLAAAGVGLVLAVLFGAGTEFMDDRIRGEHHLADANLPVIAEIPPLPTAQELSRARWRPYFALAATIVVSVMIPACVLYAFLNYYTPKPTAGQ